MTEEPSRTRARLAGAGRIAAAMAVLAGFGALLFRASPAGGPTGTRAARGGPSHTPSAAALHEGYEVKDLNAKGLGIVLLVLGGSAATLVGIVFLMITLFGGWDRRGNARLTDVQTASITPPGPHLQVDAVEDLRRQRARELQALQGYAWLDPGHTRAHIPIDRAMAMVVGHSLDDAP